MPFGFMPVIAAVRENFCNLSQNFMIGLEQPVDTKTSVCYCLKTIVRFYVRVRSNSLKRNPVMKNKKTVVVATFQKLALAACVALASNVAQAQLEEIIVTAQKRSENLNEVGLSVAVLTGSDLKEKNVTSLEDIALQVPGLSYTTSGTDTPVYTLRGVGFYESTLSAYPDVSIYVDESPLPFPVMTSHIAFDLERVEVLKGPQGTLFGNNATGGAINMIAAKPTESFEGNVTTSYGTFSDLGLDGYVSGPLGDGLKGRLAVKSVNADEWQRGYTIDAKNGKKDMLALRGILEWSPQENLRVSGTINYWQDEGEPQAPQFLQYRPNIPVVADAVSIKDQPSAPRENRAADFTDSIGLIKDNSLSSFTLRVDYDFANSMTFTSMTSYSDYEHYLQYDGDGVAERNFDVPIIEGEVTSFAQEIRLASAGEGNLHWIVGANYSEDEARDDYLLDFSVSTVTVAYPLEGFSGYYSDQTMDNWAVFASGEYEMDNFKLKAGIRYTEAGREMEGCNRDVPGGGNAELFTMLTIPVQQGLGIDPPVPFTVAPGACHTLDTNGILGNAPTGLPGNHFAVLDEDNTAWRLGLDWKASDNVLLYANITEGYKAGSLPALASSTNTQLVSVTQESVLSFEAGVKASLLERRMQLNATVFHYDYEDRQLRSKLTDPIFGKLDVLVNVPETTVDGVELEANYLVSEGLTLYLNYTYLDAVIDKFVGENDETTVGEPQDFSGTVVPFSPENQANIGGTYEWPVGSNMVALFGIDYMARSSTSAIIGGSSVYGIDSYEMLNVRAGVRSSDMSWSVMVWGKNVTDEYYWNNVTSFYDTVARYTGMPRTVGVSLSYNF
jgi:iron complex outermembrane receptor protein|tara:strand:- start:10526 stop:13045 length:2520 start_codon:yes stop_codon:yes gene_type:complete